uniref:Nuclear inhibitor of protein phosphatase 1 n=1 Tax=Tetraselmis sp. GSL018 TaxID=582737 RepID=A0A061RJ60_9CHLO
MDRWSGRDDDELLKRDVLETRIEGKGLTSFVTANPQTSNTTTGNSVHIVPSRKEQAKTFGNFQAPSWAAQSAPKGSLLKVFKSGQLITQIKLSKGVTVCGRRTDTDIPLEHASASRIHAALVPLSPPPSQPVLL